LTHTVGSIPVRDAEPGFRVYRVGLIAHKQDVGLGDIEHGATLSRQRNLIQN